MNITKTAAAALLTATTLMAGCVSAPPNIPVAQQDGYIDGCASGEKAAGSVYMIWHKDKSRYTTDPDYKSGWDKGYAECRLVVELTGCIKGDIFCSQDD